MEIEENKLFRKHGDEEVYKNNLRIVEDFYNYMQRIPAYDEAELLGFKFFHTMRTAKRNEYSLFLFNNYYLKNINSSIDFHPRIFAVFRKRTNELEFVGNTAEINYELNLSKSTINRLIRLNKDTEEYRFEERTFDDYIKYRELNVMPCDTSD